MLALPLPILTFVLSAVACALVWRLDIGNRLARNIFTGVFALIAVSTLLIGLRFGYGFEQLIVLQRIIPIFIGPMIYLGFVSLMRPQSEVKRSAMLHLGIAGFAALLPQFIPVLRAGFDIIIGLNYLFYCIALIKLWRKGPDRITYAPLRIADGLRSWMLAAAGMLAIMLVFDAVIAVSFAMQRFDDAVWLISVGSLVSMTSLMFAIVIFSKGGAKKAPAVALSIDDGSAKLEQSARDLLTQNELYLDTDLTLERLAKRLHVPARALSEAINQTQAMNVSQYVNGFRLEHASALLETTNLSVKQVMEKSGFLTRSNFYREFERVFAMSPIEFRRQKRG